MKTFKHVFWVMLCALAAFCGSPDVLMANGTVPLPDGGVNAGGESIVGDGTQPGAAVDMEHDGIATETEQREEGKKLLDGEEYILSDYDKNIIVVRPFATPVDQISRQGSNTHTTSMVVKFGSLGTRAFVTTTNGTFAAMSSGTVSQVLPAVDGKMFTIDDTILVPEVKGVYNDKGEKYSDLVAAGKMEQENVPALMLCVCGRDNQAGGKVSVYAVNGNLDDDGQATLAPAIPNGSKLIRMGKACGELDVQTGRFYNMPTYEEQYCQNFMMQVEESLFSKMAENRPGRKFSDMEEDAIYDFRLTQELSFLFGVKNKIKHISKNDMYTWFTGGIWNMAGKDLELGHWDAAKGKVVVDESDLIDLHKDLFVGTGIGNKRRVILCGSDALAALSKTESDKYRITKDMENWNLRFSGWETDFGETYLLHHELFDELGMSDCAFAFDPEYLYKKTHIPFTRHVHDMEKAVIRATKAVVIREVCCLYLRYPKAHARIRLAQAA